MTLIPWPVILDPRRLSELKSLDILDTDPEQSYDDISDIARVICDTPIANFTLVAEDRQWFKSYVGNSVQETPIEQSVCAHAIGGAGILVINDLTTDTRTSTNTLVTGEAALRFYAGVPLRLDGEFGVGTLCVLDTKPHPTGLTPEQTGALEALGRQATILLQVRRFITARNALGRHDGDMAEPLEGILDGLLAAYDLNKIHKDRVLESLISISLTHIAFGLAKKLNSDCSSIH